MNNFPNSINSSNTFPNGLYGPYGFNDNNVNRISNPSNNYPSNGGLTGNPTGRFNPLSTNTIKQMINTPSMTNFDKAYVQPYPIIEKIDYGNKNDILHNNIGENVLDETVVEYRIIINSMDRDIRYYPNPFSFVVKLNPIGPETLQYEDKRTSKIKETRFESSPRPHIEKEFRNIKYIKLENIILPQHIELEKTEDGCYKPILTENLAFDMYTSLVVKELDCDRVLTTFDDVTRIDEEGKAYTPPKPFAILIPDKFIGVNYFACLPYYGSKIYKNSDLGNLKKMTIEIFDCYGKPVMFNHLYNYDDLMEYEKKNGKPLCQSDLRHPLNKKNQLHLSFIIGVVESQINTNTKFEY